MKNKFYTFLILTLTTLFISDSLLKAQENSTETAVSTEKNSLFNDIILQEFHIYVEPDTLLWLLDEDNVNSDYEFKAQLVVLNGSEKDSIPDIGFRLRGNTSRQSQKKSFKIDINTFVKGRRYKGLKDINLNGEHNDPSIMRAELSWDLVNKLEIHASRSSHAKVFINDEYFGLYLSVEDIDDEFIAERFNTENGNLYKCLYPADLTFRGNDPESYKFESGGRRAYELKNNEDLDDYTGLRDFITFLQNSTNQTFSNEVEDKLNVDGLLRWIAVDILTGNWDNYWHNKNNYYLWHDFNTNRFHFIPYDYDNTFGIAWDNTGWADQSPDNWTPTNESRKLVTRILAIPEYKNRLHHYLNEFLTRYYTTDDMQSRWESIKSLVQQAAEEDTYRTKDYGYSVEDFNRSFVEATGAHDKYGIKPFVEERIFSLKNGQLKLNNTAAWVISEETQKADYVLTKTKTTNQSVVPSISFSLKFKDDKQIDGQKVTFRYKEDNLEFQEVTQTIYKRSSMYENEGSSVFQIFPEKSATYQIYAEIIDSDGLTTRYPRNPETYIIFNYKAADGLIVNEFMASNTLTISDEAGEFEDWVELFNNTENVLNLSDFSITDKSNNPIKFELPDSLIQPYSHVIVWLDEDQEQGSMHANFKLSKSGEFIGVYNKSTFAPIDTLSFGPQIDDLSFARLTDAEPTWDFTKATPGTPNIFTSIDSDFESKPVKTAISNVYPNPFNPSTTISFILGKNTSVQLDVFDVMGRKVQNLISNSSYSAGNYSAKWDARSVASGIYIVRLQTEETVQFQKITLIK